jgi:hypothetical protein
MFKLIVEKKRKECINYLNFNITQLTVRATILQIVAGFPLHT